MRVDIYVSIGNIFGTKQRRVEKILQSDFQSVAYAVNSRKFNGRASSHCNNGRTRHAAYICHSIDGDLSFFYQFNNSCINSIY